MNGISWETAGDGSAEGCWAEYGCMKMLHNYDVDMILTVWPCVCIIVIDPKSITIIRRRVRWCDR